MLRSRLGERFSPMYFLSALGAGGLSASFFMYLMFMVKHPDTPMVTFDHLQKVLNGGLNTASVLVGLDMFLIGFFGIIHYTLLAWNLRQLVAFRKTEAYRDLKSSNAEIGLMTIPLTLAMSVNVAFIQAVTFIPGLWDVVEWLFPAAIVAFGAIGIYGMKILRDYFVRMFVHAEFDFAENNSLAPMIAIFALSMVSVGLAAPGAMSENHLVNAISMALSIFFGTVAVILMVIKLVLGFNAMLEHGIRPAAAASLWIMIPVTTLLGISYVRMTNGLAHNFGAHGDPTDLFVFTAVTVSVQVLFGLIGYSVMKRLNYFEEFASRKHANPGAFALVCPGVAFFTFGMFFITYGLVKTGLIDQLSVTHIAFVAPFALVQLKTVQVFFRLARALLLKSSDTTAVPAEAPAAQVEEKVAVSA